MKPTILINDLIDEHGDSFSNCPGCPLCSEIRELGKTLDRQPEERYKHILGKKREMTKNEIKYLLDSEVDQLVIRTALKMGNRKFSELMNSYGFNKKRGDGNMKKDKVAGLLEEYKTMQAEHPTEKLQAIADMMGIKYKSLYYNVRKWKAEGLIDTPKPVKKETYESMKKKVAKQIKGDPELVKKLQGRIVELEDQVKGYPALQKRAAKLEIENMKMEKYLQDETLASHYQKNELEKAAEKIETLNGTVEDLMVEVADWRDKAHLYARENENMDATNRNLQEICEEQRRKSTAYLNLLKVVL